MKEKDTIQYNWLWERMYLIRKYCNQNTIKLFDKKFSFDIIYVSSVLFHILL